MKKKISTASLTGETPSAAEADLDRILGSRALFKMDLTEYGGPSAPVLYRARREGHIEVVIVGALTRLSRATVKRILTEGLPVIAPYGKLRPASAPPVTRRLRASRKLSEPAEVAA